MADLIQIRRDRDSVWREVDPVLALAEVGIVQNEDGTMSNPVQFKVGDGTTHWTDLPMQNASAVNKIRVNGSTVLTPTVVGGDRVIDLVIEVSGSVASGNTIAYSDASGHLVDSGISIVNTSGSSSTAVMTQAAVSASVAAVQGNLDSVSGSISSSISESNARIEEVATDLSENYARNDGSYDSMAVGVANNLAGDQEVEGAFISRTAGGDAEIGNGTAQILEARGKSQVWNQLNNNIRGNTTETIVYSSDFTRVKGHKYYIGSFIKTSASGNAYLSWYGFGLTEPITLSSKYQKISAIYNNDSDSLTARFARIITDASQLDYDCFIVVDLTLLFGAGNEPATVEEFEAWLYKNIGALEYYPYNAGTVLNNSMEGIETIGFNLLDPATGKAQIIGEYSDLYGNYYGITGTHGTITFKAADGTEETITPDAEGKFELTVPGVLTVATPGTDCAVFLWWDGSKTEYKPFEKSTSYLDVKHIYGKADGTGDLVQVFPDGLAGVNGIQDLLHIENGVTVAEKLMGGVDLGTLEWEKSNPHGDGYSFVNIYTEGKANGEIICDRYVHLSEVSTETASTKGISYNINRAVRIYDPAFDNEQSTEASFKAAMSGVMLYYELATPVHYTDLVYVGSDHFADNTPVELPVNYNVDNWGLENILPKNTEEAVLTGPADITCRYSINAVEILNTHTDQIEDLYDSKADKNGTYPKLVAGNLVDADGVGSEQQFMFRPTGGTQAVAEKTQAVLQKYMGKTLAWNQLITNSLSNFSNVYYTDSKTEFNSNIQWHNDSSFISGVTGSGNIGFYSVILDCPSSATTIRIKHNGTERDIDILPKGYISVVGGHKYYLSYYVKKNNPRVLNELVLNDITFVDLTLMFGAGNEPSTVEEFEALFPLPYYAYNEGTLISNKADSIETVGFNQWDEEWEQGRLNIETGKNSDNGDSKSFRSKHFIPTFENTDYYFQHQYIDCYVIFYDSSTNYIGNTYISTSRVFTTPENTAYLRFYQWSNQNIEYTNDICINLSDPAKNGTYEPYEKHSTKIGLGEFKVKDSEGNEITVNGLKSAGSVYDEIDPVKKKYVKRIGEVDLGTLNWGFYAPGTYAHTFRSNPVSDIKHSNVYDMANAICQKYTIQETVGGEGYPMSLRVEPNGNLDVRNDSYSDADTFKTAMSGVMLYYELATPIEYDLVGSIPEAYPVFGGGTEAIEPSGVDEETGVPLTAPFRAVIFYSKDYLSQLNNMPEDYTSKESLVNMLEALKTAGIIGSYTMTWDSTTGKYTFTITAPTPAS